MTIIYIIVGICIAFMLFVIFFIGHIQEMKKENRDAIIGCVPLALFVLMLCVIFRL